MKAMGELVDDVVPGGSARVAGEVTECDACGSPVEVGPFGYVLPHASGKPRALCHGCYEERRQRDLEVAQARSRADAACWKAFREDWLSGREDHDRLAARLMAQVRDKDLYEPMLKHWREKHGKGARGGRGKAGDAGF